MTLTIDEIIKIYIKSIYGRHTEVLPPELIACYYGGNFTVDVLSSWLNKNGVEFPMTEEQEVEFKLRFL